MGPTVRRALPDDADFIVWTILTAQRGPRPRGWFDIALGLPEAECAAFVRQIVLAPVVSMWHLTHFWIVEQDGVAAAALCALPEGEARMTARLAIEHVAQATAMGPGLTNIWQRGAYAATCWIWGDDHTWFVEHVATRPAHRGQGLVQMLLDHVLDVGRTRGFTRASIGFYIGNDVAERSYAKAGFRFADERRDPDFEALTGAPGFRRFERAI